MFHTCDPEDFSPESCEACAAWDRASDAASEQYAPEDGGVMETTPWSDAEDAHFDQPAGFVAQIVTTLTAHELIDLVDALGHVIESRYGKIDPSLAPPIDSHYFHLTGLMARLITEGARAGWYSL